VVFDHLTIKASQGNLIYLKNYNVSIAVIELFLQWSFTIFKKQL